MDIVLDSNIFRGDFLLRSKDFEVLIDYLRKTNSSIILPQVILDEVKELYSRALKERLVTHNKAITNINIALADESKHLKAAEIDIDVEVKAYEAFIKSKLSIYDRRILPYTDSFLKEISIRAIKRQKPCGEDGQGFRDTLIWLTIKEYCRTCHEKQITFISNNDKDFGNSEKTDLHESLSTECEQLNIRINYCKNVREFIERHSVKIDVFNAEWVESNVDIEAVNGMIEDEINGNKPRSIQSWLNSKRDIETSEYFKATNVNTYEFKEFFVYEMLGNKYIINVQLGCEVEIEHEYYDKTYGGSWEEYYSRRIQVGYEYLDFDAHISMTYENGEVVDIELGEIEI
jgi:hypothetical protein